MTDTAAAPPDPRALTRLAWTSFLMPLVVSVLANLTWGVGTGSVVLIVAGLVSPLLLVLAIERWRALPGLTGAARVVQVVGMGIVATVAAGWSWVHTTELLLDAALVAYDKPTVSALPWLVVVLCVAAPLAVDGLAVLSVQTLAVTSTTTPSGTGRVGHGAATPRPIRLTTTPPPAEPDPEPAPVVPEPAAWGPPDSVPEPPAKPTRVRLASVPGQRSKRELEAAARELGVKRKANERVDGLRARVELAERARAREGASA